MTAPTTASRPPAASPGAAPTAPPPGVRQPAPRSRLRAALGEVFAGTPGRLRLLGGLAIMVMLLFAAIGFVSADRLHADISGARSNAAQLVRVQTVLTSLVQADANATNAFLVGGLEPAAEASAYTQGISTAAQTIAAAASANHADAATLGSVNQVLAVYAGLIQSARANNRQGFPIGAAYLRQASTTLQEQAIPPLAALIKVEEQRVNDSTSAGATTRGALATVFLVGLVALLVLQIWIFRKTNRLINRPILLATVVLLVAALAGLALIGWSKSRTDDAHSGAYAETVALATARIEGFDAKSAEALTLINRGNGQDYEALFQSVSGAATEQLQLALPVGNNPLEEADTASDFSTYLTAHKQVRALDDGGNWDQAVAMATGSGAANRDFDTFQTDSAKALTGQADQLSSSLNHARLPLAALAWILLLAGIVAAVATWRGVEQRLAEYR